MADPRYRDGVKKDQPDSLQTRLFWSRQPEAIGWKFAHWNKELNTAVYSQGQFTLAKIDDRWAVQKSHSDSIEWLPDLQAVAIYIEEQNEEISTKDILGQANPSSSPQKTNSDGSASST